MTRAFQKLPLQAGRRLAESIPCAAKMKLKSSCRRGDHGADLQHLRHDFHLHNWFSGFSGTGDVGNQGSCLMNDERDLEHEEQQ